MGATAINQALMAKLALDISPFQAGMRTAPKIAKRAGQAIASGFRIATAAIVAVAAATAGAIAVLGRMAERGQKVINIQQAFGRIAGDNALAIRDLKDATGGLVSEYELMVQANTAITLGSAKNIEQFAELARTAQQLGRALGVDAGFALNSLNIGIARQSKLILDNLGIIVSVEQANKKYAASLGTTVKRLTDAHKKEAFRTEALRQAREALLRLGETGATAGDMFRRFTTTLGDVKDAIAKLVAESGTLKILFFELGGFAEKMLTILKADAVTLNLAFETLGRLAGASFKAGLVGGSEGIANALSRAILGGSREDFLKQINQELQILSILAGTPPRGGQPGGGGILGSLNPPTMKLVNAELKSAFETLGRIAQIPPPNLIPANMIAFGDAIRDHAISAVADLATEFKNVLNIVRSLGQVILRELVTALARARFAGDSLGAVFKFAGPLGVIGAGVGIISQFFQKGGIVRPQRSLALAGGGVPIVAHPGEVVLNKRTVDRMGGPAAANQLNRGGSAGGQRVELVIRTDDIGEPTDYGIIATKPQVLAMLSDALRNLKQNGFEL